MQSRPEMAEDPQAAAAAAAAAQQQPAEPAAPKPAAVSKRALCMHDFHHLISQETIGMWAPLGEEGTKVSSLKLDSSSSTSN